MAEVWSEQQVILEAWQRGHFWNPERRHQINQDDLRFLRLTDQPVIDALQSYSKADPYRYAKHVWQKHNRAPWFDGVAGPAMMAMMADKGVCPVPDHAPPAGVQFQFASDDLQQIALKMQSDAALPAIGSGQWQGCHGVGDYHSAVAMWDLSGIPSFLQPHFTTVLRKVREAMARLGFLWHFIDSNGRDMLREAVQHDSDSVNTHCNFVPRSDGWIGLAILGGREQCHSQPIWARFLATFRGGQSAKEIINQWWTLIMHELLHNLGRNHVRGGIMNPSLQNGLQMTLIGDTSERWFRQQFGGVAVPIPGEDDPTPPPDGDDDNDGCCADIELLRLNQLVMQAQIDFLFEQRRAA